MSGRRFAPRLGLPILLGTGALALVSCGGSSQESVGARRALGAKALLVASDLPSGWTAGARSSDGSEPNLEREVAACLHVPVGLIEEGPAAAHSPNFTDRAERQISSTVTVTPTKADAEKAFAVFDKPGTRACAASAITKSLAASLRKSAGGQQLPGLSFGKAQVSGLGASSAADSTVGYRLVVPILVLGHRFKAIFDAVVLRVGRADATVTFAGHDTTVDRATEQRLTGLTATRLKAVLSGS